VRFLIPLLANNTVRLKNLGFVKAELEAPEKTIAPTPDKPIPPPVPQDTPIIHKVSEGDTFAKIARANGLTVKQLKELNSVNGEPLTNFTALKIK